MLQLTTSYRSVPEIQRFVNAAFAPVMTGDDETRCRPTTCRLRRRADRHDVATGDRRAAGAEAVRPRRFRRLKASGKAIDDVAAGRDRRLHRMAHRKSSGWTVAEKQADGAETRVPIQPRHIAILFRRFVSYGEDVTRAYIDAIEARGIPHLLVGGKAFHGREEVETIRAALAAIEWPDDELSVFATLKGSLFAIDDEQLLEFRHRFGTFHPFRIPKELGGNSGQELALTAEPTAQLTADCRGAAPAAAAAPRAQLSAGRRHDWPAARRRRARTSASSSGRPASRRSPTCCTSRSSRASTKRAAASRSAASSTSCATRAASEAAEAPILEEGSDGVRLMTVHKAKGLEFPVVILADLTCSMSRNDASRYLDASRGLCAMKIGGWAPHELHRARSEEVARDQAEGVRLAYVAATRARDLLVVPALGDDPWEGGWFGPLNGALYPPVASRRHAGRGAELSGVQVEGLGAAAAERRAGRHRHRLSRPASTLPPKPARLLGRVVGSRRLKLDEKPTFGVRRDDLIVKDVPRNVIADGRSRYDRWHLARDDARAAGAVPSLTVETARDWVTVEFRIRNSEFRIRDGRRRRTERRGSALGRNRLRSARARAAGEGAVRRGPGRARRPRGDRGASARSHGRGRGRGRGGRGAAADHDVLVRARAADVRGACRRETPVTCTLPNGTLIEGVVDLAFEEAGEWTVVDYKTDREVAASGEDQYRRQVALYASAIAQATGQPARGILMRV